MKKNKYKILFIIILLIQSVILFHKMDIKSDLYVDEIYTYSLANSPNGMFFPPKISNKTLKFDLWNKWLPGQIFKEYITVSPGLEFSFSNVYNNQLQDTHPPLYYFIIHSICSFFTNSFSKWYGLSLNLVLFIITQLLLFRVSNLIIESKKYALLTCIFYGFSCAALDNFTYISSNTLITLCNLLFLNIIVKCLKEKITVITFIEIMFTIIIGGLSHYIFLLYSIILVLSLIKIFIKNKKQDQISIFLTASIFGFISIYLIFPEIINQILTSIAIKEINLNIQNLIPNLGVLAYFLRKFFLIPIPYCFHLGNLLFIVFCIYFAKNYIIKFLKEFNNDILYLLIIPIVIIFPIISCGINYQVSEINPNKYILVFFPIISIILTATLKQLNKKYLTISIILLVIIVTGYNVIIESEDTSKQQTSFVKKILNDSNTIYYIQPKENLQIFVPYFSICNNVLLLDYDKYDLNKLDPSKLIIQGKNYLVVKNNAILNENFKKITSFKFSTFQADIYYITCP